MWRDYKTEKFDWQGNRISEETLIAQGCNADCGFRSCRMRGELRADFSIRCVDTVRWTAMCDSTGTPRPHTAREWIHLEEGTITAEGRIVVTDTSIVKKLP